MPLIFFNLSVGTITAFLGLIKGEILLDLSKLSQGTNFAHLIATHNPDHNNNGDFSIDNDVVFINENQNDFTWSGISIINPKILIIKVLL